jgi:hypothetical protein
MKYRLGGLALLTVLASASAQAILLVPGARAGRGTLEAPGVLTVFTDTNLTLLASNSMAVNGASGTVSGTLRSSVYMNSGGTLDFYYQYSNDLGFDPIHRLTMSSFRNFTTDVGYRLTPVGQFTAGTIIPNEANRNTSGSVVGFDFDTPVSIPPGATSQILVIRTNANDWGPGFASVINGSATTVASFGPVPEPATMAALGLGAIALIRRRRRK